MKQKIDAFITKYSRVYAFVVLGLLIAGMVGGSWAAWQVVSIIVAVLMAIYYVAAKIQGK